MASRSPDKKTPEDVAAGLGKVIRPPIIWLAFQDCTGCTESLLQTSHPGFGDLILNVISLEYHETLMAGSGLQARQALDEAVTKYAGKYVLVVEGSIPTGAHGIYMKLAGRPRWTYLRTWAGKAAAIIAIGSCATWGGIPSADPDPTGAVGVVDLMPEKSIVNLPGCPPNPYTAAWCLIAIRRPMARCRSPTVRGDRNSLTIATFMSIVRGARTSTLEIS
jgi:hydrogenase small subunit